MSKEETVKKAKGKECPFYAMALIISMYKEGWHPEDDTVLFCKANNCMMWRWDQDRYGVFTGYCGLAGKL